MNIGWIEMNNRSDCMVGQCASLPLKYFVFTSVHFRAEGRAGGGVVSTEQRERSIQGKKKKQTKNSNIKRGRAGEQCKFFS